MWLFRTEVNKGIMERLLDVLKLIFGFLALVYIIPFWMFIGAAFLFGFRLVDNIRKDDFWLSATIFSTTIYFLMIAFNII